MLNCTCYYQNRNPTDYINMGCLKMITYLKEYLAEKSGYLTLCCLKMIMTRKTFLFNKKSETFEVFRSFLHHVK